MNSLGMSGISTSMCSDMDRDLVSCIFFTIILLLVTDLEFLLPYTARMSYIRSCGVLLSCMWYTKWLLVCPYSYSSLTKKLNSSDPPSVLK
jgi:hypothetical protein